MSDSLAQQVRVCLLSYLANQSSLRDLWLWLQTNIVATEADRSSAELRSLAGTLLLHLSEYTAGHRTEAELRALFLPMLTNYPISSDSTAAVSAYQIGAGVMARHSPLLAAPGELQPRRTGVAPSSAGCGQLVKP